MVYQIMIEQLGVSVITNADTPEQARDKALGKLIEDSAINERIEDLLANGETIECDWVQIEG